MQGSEAEPFEKGEGLDPSYEVAFLEVTFNRVILSRRRRISHKDETLRVAQGDNGARETIFSIATWYQALASS